MIYNFDEKHYEVTETLLLGCYKSTVCAKVQYDRTFTIHHTYKIS